MANLAHGASNSLTPYERMRAQRIAANEQLLASLGIPECMDDLVATCRTVKSHRKRAVGPVQQEVIAPACPTRRSTRLQGTTPGRYTEPKHLSQSEEPKRRRIRNVALNVGPRVEEYTDEDEKLLGSYVKQWQLFVDGCGSNGKRIYDPVAGKTCHQCRQKTLGHRTSCSHCKLVQGQFCGDCLFMRYGENVLEANKVHGWKCPPCRGICNCSICRAKNGWSATGPLWQQVHGLGYKSVAHFLILTRRKAPTKTEADEVERRAGRDAEEVAGKGMDAVGAREASSGETSSGEGSSGLTGDTSHVTTGSQTGEAVHKTSGKILLEVDQRGAWGVLSVAKRVSVRQRRHSESLQQTHVSEAKEKARKTSKGRKRTREESLMAPRDREVASDKLAGMDSTQAPVQVASEELNHMPVRRSTRQSAVKRINWSEALQRTKKGHRHDKTGTSQKRQETNSGMEASAEDDGDTSAGGPDKEYVVERIIQWRGPVGRREALIKWEGYSDEHNTWEPEDNINL